MPELPDLEYIVEILQRELEMSEAAALEIYNPIILRILTENPIEQLLPHKQLLEIRRHGPFVVFAFTNDFWLVVHPMLAGRFRLENATARKLAADCVRLDFANGRSLFYHDSKQMGKIYFLHKNDAGTIPRFSNQGIDVLSPHFTEHYFLTAIERSRKQVRVFLMEQETLSAIGNAYADEILFAAKIHPKTFCYQLTDAQKSRLFQAVNEVIQWGIEQVESAARPVHEKVRDHMKIRNRQGQPCPQCGTKVRRAGVRGFDSFFCPKCQPPAREQFISWIQ